MLLKTPNLLAIDSSSNLASISLQYNGKISSKTIDNARHQATSILPKINELLEENKIKLDNLDAYVLSNGPGRFTGLRIATSCVQGLAFCSNKKIIVIDSLRLLAQQYATEVNSEDKVIWVCQKAYNKVYYFAKFIFDTVTKTVSNTTTESMAITLDELIITLKSRSEVQISNINLVGNGWDDLPYKLSLPIYNVEPHVKYIFSLANMQYQNGNLVDAAQISPQYIVNPYSRT